MRYEVVFRQYTDRHFVKRFARKYKGAWDKTTEALILEFSNIEILFQKTIAEVICKSETGSVKICKTEFKIAGSQISRHASGYRCIIAVCDDKALVEVLLVYAKGDLGGNNETSAWKELIKTNYPEYKYLFQ